MSASDNWKSIIKGQKINNFYFPLFLTEETANYALNYKPLNGDKFVVTYPKSGTTWTQQIIYLILNDGIPEKNNKDFIFDTYLEYGGERSIKKPIIKTHLPYNLLPINKKAKYLFVFRNPKDTCVSLYHYIKNRRPLDIQIDFHQFFAQWINGGVCYGNYFKNTLENWLHRNDDNFHYLIYEQMKTNPREAVLKIGEFLGKEFVEKLTENSELILNEVLKYSTLDYMKTDVKRDECLFRKGIVGDWRNHFNKEESDMVDSMVREYFSGTQLEILWNKDMKWL